MTNSEILRLPLHAIAHGRAGDKGNVSNISLIAYLPEAYDFIASEVSEKKWKPCLPIWGQGGETL